MGLRINVNGVDLYYEVHGSGRPLIMLHGNGEDHTIFYESMVILRKYFTVYTVDSRDHGSSTRVSELHYRDMADDMVAFMDALDLKDVVFYGFSDGGIIGLLASMKTPRIGMLITSGANISPKGVKLPLRLLVAGMYAATKDPKMHLMMAEPDITPEELGTISIPAVIMAGEKDLVLPEETKLIADSIPGSRLRIIPGEGHGSYIVHKSVLADIILEETGICAGSSESSLTPEQMKTLLTAQQGEADAVMMYERLAAKVKEEKDAAAFRRLAGDEARHEAVFRKYTGQDVKANPAKAIFVPLMYKVLGRDKVYPIIAKGEYDAAEKYKHIVNDYPEVEEVMNDETHHGDAVMGLLK